MATTGEASPDTFVITRVFNAPRQRVWDAWTKPEQFGKWFGLVLSAESKRQLWVPPGFAHGFLVLSDFAEVLYKATELYAPAFERSILWSDPAIGIEWPLDGDPTLSEKDKAGSLLADAETYPPSSGV